MTQDELKEFVSYDYETGLFTRIKRTSPRVKIGDICGWKDSDGYLNISLKSKTWKLHRLVWLYMYGKFPENEIDHVNGIRSDNRLCNLRQATRSQNCINKTFKNKVGFKGVCWRQHAKKFAAVIQKEKKSFFLGYFDTAEQASDAYLKASSELHGEFAQKQIKEYAQQQRDKMEQSPL